MWIRWHARIVCWKSTTNWNLEYGISGSTTWIQEQREIPRSWCKNWNPKSYILRLHILIRHTWKSRKGVYFSLLLTLQQSLKHCGAGSSQLESMGLLRQEFEIPQLTARHSFSYQGELEHWTRYSRFSLSFSWSALDLPVLSLSSYSTMIISTPTCWVSCPAVKNGELCQLENLRHFVKSVLRTQRP